MVKYKVIIGLSIVFIHQSFVQGQNNVSNTPPKIANESVSSLKVGDKCPDFELKNIINFSKTSAKLSDFKGKWVILDFWFTSCQPCIAMMPKSAAIEKKYAGKIAFLPVTFNSEREVRELFSKMNDGKGATYRCVVDAKSTTILYKLFGHTSEPHYVWIDPNGIVKAITDQREVNEKNVELFLDGKDISLPVKNDPQVNSSLNFEFSKPLLINGNGGDGSELVYHSIITFYIDGQPTQVQVKPGRITAINESIFGLYRLAFAYATEEHYDFPLSKTVLEVSDTSLYHLTPYQTSKMNNQAVYDWLSKHSYCYNLELPYESYGYEYNFRKLAELKKNPEFRKREKMTCNIMEQDLNRIFNLRGSIQKRKVPCYILTVVDKSKLKASSNEYIMKNDKAYFLNMKGGTVSQFLDPFKFQYFPFIPFVDETGFSEKLDIEITTTMGNMNKVNEELRKYGLNFVYGERCIEVLVLIEDKINSK